MYFYKKLTLIAFYSFTVNFAYATNLDVTQKLEPLTDIEVQVKRALKTPSGSYLLQMGSGYWKPDAILYDVKNKKISNLFGIQTGNDIAFSSSENRELATGLININGMLNAETGVYRANLMDKNEGFKQEVIFSPMVSVENRPTFIFKFYGTSNSLSDEKIIHQIEVIDRKTKQRYQMLSGFSADIANLQYIDLNLDGYFDLVLEASSGLMEPNRSIYWMYNPKTKKFQRSPQLEKLGGTPQMNIATKEIKFGNGDVYLIKDGQFYKIQN